MKYLYKIYLKDEIPLLVFILIVFVAGIFFGAIAVNLIDYSVKQDLFNYFNDFLNNINRMDYSSGMIFSDSIRFNLLNIFIIWVFGLSVILMPLIPVFVFFKGFILGFTVGFLTLQYSFRGVIVAVFTVFPQNILIVPAYLLAGVTGVSFSLHIIRFLWEKQDFSSGDFIDYSLRILLLSFLLLGGSLLETYLSPLIFRFLAAYLF